MIEVIVPNRCDACQRCVDVCPANVFEIAADGTPYIVSQHDCQSCYMCELYCSNDAIYVGFDCERPEGITVEQALASGTLGDYRKYSGWDEWSGQHSNQHWRMGSVFKRAAQVQAKLGEQVVSRSAA